MTSLTINFVERLRTASRDLLTSNSENMTTKQQEGCLASPPRSTAKKPHKSIENERTHIQLIPNTTLWVFLYHHSHIIHTGTSKHQICTRVYENPIFLSLTNLREAVTGTCHTSQTSSSPKSKLGIRHHLLWNHPFPSSNIQTTPSHHDDEIPGLHTPPPLSTSRRPEVHLNQCFGAATKPEIRRQL